MLAGHLELISRKTVFGTLKVLARILDIPIIQCDIITQKLILDLSTVMFFPQGTLKILAILKY